MTSRNTLAFCFVGGGASFIGIAPVRIDLWAVSTRSDGFHAPGAALPHGAWADVP